MVALALVDEVEVVVEVIEIEEEVVAVAFAMLFRKETVIEVALADFLMKEEAVVVELVEDEVEEWEVVVVVVEAVTVKEVLEEEEAFVTLSRKEIATGEARVDSHIVKF